MDIRVEAVNIEPLDGQRLIIRNLQSDISPGDTIVVPDFLPSRGLLETRDDYRFVVESVKIEGYSIGEGSDPIPDLVVVTHNIHGLSMLFIR